MTADTSIKTYHDLQEHFKSQKEWVLYCVQNTYKPSSTDITNVSKLPRTSVCGRLRELEEEGRIHKHAKKIDPFTKQEVYWYALGTKEGQRCTSSVHSATNCTKHPTCYARIAVADASSSAYSGPEATSRKRRV